MVRLGVGGEVGAVVDEVLRFGHKVNKRVM